MTQLLNRPNIEIASVKKTYDQFEQLIREIRKSAVPVSISESIDQHIAELNAVTDNGHELRKVTRQKQNAILKSLEKELKVVPRNHYLKLWMALGMSAFGLPIGVAIGLSLGNIGLLAVGLPIGMGIGAAVGKNMDNKAVAEGRTLDIEIK
ncbi:MAG: hypothetical protein EOO01_21585 [Chitinophagaceae bacterium]|nr:MAG: hypothetical protein EOO01_21585 [Chitinophagaceae bacterium]